MNPIFDTLSARALDCEQLVRDIDLIRPVTYETDPPVAKVSTLINGMAALYDLRFAALFEAYSKALAVEGFFVDGFEDCIMQWWGACDDLRCAAEGAEHALLDDDGFDNVMLGVHSMSLVRAARFHRLVEQAKAAAAAAEAEASAPQGAAPTSA